MRELSIADAQMIEIVKSISCNSRVILMDEPTSSLTEHETQFLFKKIFELKQEGITIIFISHKLEEIFNIADYNSIFRDGKHIITGKAEEFTRASLIEKMVGREMKEVYPPRTSQPGKVLLEVKGLSRKGVFDNISFHVCKGEILGMSGLVGAGRTEIARAMIGLDTKDSGDVFLDGEKLDIKSINDSIRNGIAMVSEDRHRDGLILQRDIEENISLVALRYSFGRQVIPMKKEKSLVLDMMRQFSIKAPSEATGTWTLSGGNQQKVVLAKWMSLGPKVLIMDEPTRGIDVKTKYEIYKMMNTFTDAGLAIIMINSDMEELLGMSDRILVIRKGTIAGELTRAEANPNAIMILAVGGKQ
jgi:ABC-type sugar transport system ATPase subunit